MSRIIDLTMTLKPGMHGVAWETAKTIEADGWNARNLQLYSHCATHMDAPCHFVPGGGTIDQIDPAIFIGPARVIDLEPVEPCEELTVERLAAWSDRIGPGDRIILKTGWSGRADAPDYRTHNPFVGPELARWLVERGVAMVAVEPHSVADTRSIEPCTIVHRILLEAGVVIVEGLTNLDQLSIDVIEFLVFPLKIEGGDGSPARAIAIEQ